MLLRNRTNSQSPDLETGSLWSMLCFSHLSVPPFRSTSEPPGSYLGADYHCCYYCRFFPYFPYVSPFLVFFFWCFALPWSLEPMLLLVLLLLGCFFFLSFLFRLFSFSDAYYHYYCFFYFSIFPVSPFLVLWCLLSLLLLLFFLSLLCFLCFSLSRPSLNRRFPSLIIIIIIIAAVPFIVSCPSLNSTILFWSGVITFLDHRYHRCTRSPLSLYYLWLSITSSPTHWTLKHYRNHSRTQQSTTAHCTTKQAITKTKHSRPSVQYKIPSRYRTAHTNRLYFTIAEPASRPYPLKPFFTLYDLQALVQP